MKTILYQPLFINPQAYFVFPQLYHIEKGDSYIEPANITGQLIINNLSEGLTLTPTVNVIQDSNQVDFSLFKGKHIRISQYTNIGAVVLGEWYIPGTPEPEQPDWFKESIVAWYSPYCKQGLTNYDVIEAYTEDFTTWVYNQNAGVANITSNTITISESFTSQNIVEDTNSPYSDLSIYVTGITEIDIQKYMSGTYSINNSKTTPIFVDTNKDINTNENPSNSSISSTYVYDIEREGDLTYPEDKEECIAYGMSTSPNRLIWGDYETTEPLKFTDYITIHSGHNMLAEFYYKTDNIGYINSYILIFKKDKVTEQVYKTYIRVTKELLNSIHGVNNLLIELTYTGSIGSKWEEFDDELLYKPYIRTKGTFAQKPLSSQGIQQGFSYFCTDKQTVEGSRSGIMIYYAGNDTWVDALGRYV